MNSDCWTTTLLLDQLIANYSQIYELMPLNMYLLVRSLSD